MQTETFTQKLMAFLDFKKLPKRPETNEVIPTFDPGLSSLETYSLPGSHGEVRFRIYAQCACYLSRHQVLILSCVSKLIQTPATLRDSITEFVNLMNKERSTRSCVAYYGPNQDKIGNTEFRVSLVMFEGAWSRTAFNETLNSEILYIVSRFHDVLTQLITFFHKDPSFEQRHSYFENNQKFLSQFTPLASLHSNFINDITEASYALMKQSKARSECSLFANGIVTFEEEVIVLMRKVGVRGKIICDLGFVEVKAEFQTEEGSLIFENTPDSEQKVARVNSQLPLGCYHLSTSGLLYFSLKSCHCCLDKRDRPVLARFTIDWFLLILKETLSEFSNKEPSYPSHIIEGYSRDVGRPRSELTDAGLKIDSKTIELIRERIKRSLWGVQFLRPGQAVGDYYYIALGQGVEKLARPLDMAKERLVKAFFEDLAREGVYFARIPMYSVYFVENSAKLAPDFDPTDLCTPSSSSVYYTTLCSILSSFRSPTPPSDPSLAAISPHFLLEPHRLFDKTRQVVSGFKIYGNTLNSQPIVLHNLTPKACDRVGRMMAYRHPNLARVYGFVSTEQGKFLVREKANYRLTEKVGPDETTQFKILKGVAEGLAYLHDNEEYHLRLTPENIVLISDDHPLLTDFGLYVSESDFKFSKDQFSDPELLARRGGVDKEKADVWSFGLVMHWVLVGRTLFETHCNGDLWDKENFIKEVGYKYRRPLIANSYERDNPKLVLLMRSCLYPEAKNRPRMNEIVKALRSFEVMQDA